MDIVPFFFFSFPALGCKDLYLMASAHELLLKQMAARGNSVNFRIKRIRIDTDFQIMPPVLRKMILFSKIITY